MLSCHCCHSQAIELLFYCCCFYSKMFSDKTFSSCLLFEDFKQILDFLTNTLVDEKRVLCFILCGMISLCEFSTFVINAIYTDAPAYINMHPHIHMYILTYSHSTSPQFPFPIHLSSHT